MNIVIYLLRQTLLLCIDLLQIAMLARAIVGLFDPMREGGLSMFLYTLTEPIIMPFRILCDKMHWFEGFPLDMPFLFTVILLSLLQFSLTVL